MPVLAHCRLPAWRLPAACRQCHSRCAPAKHAERTINKVPIVQGLDARTYDYLLNHTREPQVLQRLREETAALRGARMQITPEQGQFMAQLAQLLGVRKYLEIGVFTGYSALAVALALPPDGTVVALERDPRPLEMAKRFWGEAGVSNKVECRVGPAAEALPEVAKSHGRTFDMAFVDADKAGYRNYYEALLGLVRPGGLIAIDNVLWYGKVADPSVTDKATTALRDLNAFLLTDERIDFTIVPVGDGIAMCRVRA